MPVLLEEAEEGRTKLQHPQLLLQVCGGERCGLFSPLPLRQEAVQHQGKDRQAEEQLFP